MKKFYLLFTLLFLNFIIVMSQNDKTLLLGKWINYYNANNYLIFDSDNFKIVNNSFEYSQTWALQKSGVFLTKSEYDTITFPYYYFFSDNFMVILTMKPYLDQVDEVTLFVKDSLLMPPTTKNSKIKILINSYKPGLYMVLLPNFQRYNSDIDVIESREIIVDNNFVESSMLILPFDYALKNFEFYLNGVELQHFFDSEVEENKSIQNEDIIVCIYGFNQIGRETINNTMNRRINGDILMFYIGPYKDFEIYPTAADF